MSAFVIRWFKRTSIRPNRPLVALDAITREYEDVQDGPTPSLLCWECEQELGIAEREFNNRLFTPYHAGKTTSVPYDRWLGRFVAANVWRVLQFHLEGPVDTWPPRLLRRGRSAAEHWRTFLRGERRGMSAFPVHLLAVEGFAPDLYRDKVLEMTVAANSKTGDEFIFVKMGALLLVGVLHDADPKRWRHTVVDVRSGTWNPWAGLHRMPTWVKDYVVRSTNIKLPMVLGPGARRKPKGKRR